MDIAVPKRASFEDQNSCHDKIKRVNKTGIDFKVTQINKTK